MGMSMTGGFFNRLFSGGAHVNPADGLVEVGDRFFQVGMGTTVWVVERECSQGTCNIKHVVIHRHGSFPDSKIISVDTLLDASMYRRDRRDHDVITPSVHSRRKLDRPRV